MEYTVHYWSLRTDGRMSRSSMLRYGPGSARTLQIFRALNCNGPRLRILRLLGTSAPRFFPTLADGFLLLCYNRAPCPGIYTGADCISHAAPDLRLVPISEMRAPLSVV